MIFGIIRAFSGSEEYLERIIMASIRNLLDIGVDRVVAVIDLKKDKRETDLKISERFSAKKVSLVRIEDYLAPNCWSLGLNKGIDFVKDGLKGTAEDFLLVVSNEVSLTKEALEDMKKAITPGVAVAGVKFSGFNAESYLTPRNTCALWRLGVLEESGGFDEKYDWHYGMEDYALILKLRERGYSYVLIESNVMLDINPSLCQTKKEQKESIAMKMIRLEHGIGH